MDFVQRKLPSPGFQVEVVLVDYNSAAPKGPNQETAAEKSNESSSAAPNPVDANAAAAAPNQNKGRGNDKDDVFSDSEAEESVSSKLRQAQAASADGGPKTTTASGSETSPKTDQVASLTHATEQFSLGNAGSQEVRAASQPKIDAVSGAMSGLGVNNSESEFKVMAADASVFTFGDEDDYESE